MTITGGGGQFNPTSLTISAGTRVTWTNIGNDLARVRDVGHLFLDSGDLNPTQTFSFTFCVGGTFQIEDAHSGVTATIIVSGGPSPSPSTSPSPSPSASPSPSTSPSPSSSPSPSPSPSPSASPSPAAQPVNISTRARVETGERVLIGGFIITGADPKPVILRGLGPSMAALGVPDVIGDPILRLFNSTGSEIMMNDNWQDTQAAQIEATGIPPQDPFESAIVVTLSPSAYTTTLSNAESTNGVGLVEIYDLNTATASRLGNISTRGFVGAGDNVMIGGFVLGGSSINPSRVVARALGPSLAQTGITDPLNNPTLQLFDSNGQSIIFNDNWMDDPSQIAELQALNLAPSNPAESAILAVLPPGMYTGVVAGQGGATGIGLVEVYGIQ